MTLVVDNNTQDICYELSEQLGVRSVKQETEQRLKWTEREIRQNVERGKGEVGEGTGAEVRQCGRGRWRHGGQ